MTSNDRLIVALDFTNAASALSMAKRLRGLVRTVKVGSALFTACGPALIQRVRLLGFDVMLDLKFLDIPSTVELSCRAAVHHRVSLLTVHAAGGRTMLAAAVHGAGAEAVRLRVKRPQVLAVTILTSVGKARANRMSADVHALAQAALRAGCDGVVASAQEAGVLREAFGARLRIVCPGIRPSGVRSDDQRRVVSPREAIARGADLLVIGRPITAAPHPRAAVQQILSEMEGANRC